jgi:hypothetical protein
MGKVSILLIDCFATKKSTSHYKILAAKLLYIALVAIPEVSALLAKTMKIYYYVKYIYKS